MRTETCIDKDDLLLDLGNLAQRVQEYRRCGESVALCHGTFDLLHVGHIKHLKQASEYADRLVVTITADSYVNKGPDRPIFKHGLRAEHLDALEGASAARAGLGRSDTRTPAELAGALGRAVPDEVPSLEQALRVYESVRYGGRSLDAEAERTLRESVARVRRATARAA